MPPACSLPLPKLLGNSREKMRRIFEADCIDVIDLANLAVRRVSGAIER